MLFILTAAAAGYGKQAAVIKNNRANNPHDLLDDLLDNLLDKRLNKRLNNPLQNIAVPFCA